MPRKYVRRFHYFKVGEEPARANLTIVEQVCLTNQQQTTKYIVEYNCCKVRTTMLHSSICHRHEWGVKRCRACSGNVTKQAKQTEQAKQPVVRALSQEDLTAPYGVSPPSWPVPNPNVIGKHLLWCDRMTEKT